MPNFMKKARIAPQAKVNKSNDGASIGGVILVAGALIGAGIYFGLAGNHTGNARRIAVSGECLSTVGQDMTAVTIRFVAVNTNPTISMDLARNAYEVFSKRVRDIDDGTIKLNTTRFDSYEKTEWNHNENRSVILGTETTIELEVATENRNTIEQLIALAGNNKFTEVQGLRMYTSNKTMKPALEACIKTAVENARDKATAIANADGRKIGKMTAAEYTRTVSSGGGVRPMMKTAMYNAASYDTATGAPELFSSDSDISVTVNVEFEVR